MSITEGPEPESKIISNGELASFTGSSTDNSELSVLLLTCIAALLSLTVVKSVSPLATFGAAFIRTETPHVIISTYITSRLPWGSWISRCPPSSVPSAFLTSLAGRLSIRPYPILAVHARLTG